MAYYAPAIAGFLPEFKHLEKTLFEALLRRNYLMQEFWLYVTYNHRRRTHSSFGKARQLAVGGQMQAAYLVLAVDEAGAGSAGIHGAAAFVTLYSTVFIVFFKHREHSLPYLGFIIVQKAGLRPTRKSEFG